MVNKKEHRRPSSVVDLIICADHQYPFVSEPCWALAKDYTRRIYERAQRKNYNPPHFIFNGDMSDMWRFSRFSKIGRGPDTIKEELEGAHEHIYKPIRDIMPDGFIEANQGNHEFRFDGTLALVEAQSGPVGELGKYLKQTSKVSYSREVGLDKLKIKWNEKEDGNGMCWPLDTLCVMHGKFAGANPAQRYAKVCDFHVVASHTHKAQTVLETKAISGNTYKIMTTGALCDHPSWNSMHQYDFGFVAGWYDKKTGVFDLQHKLISGPGNTELYCEFGLLNAKHTNKGWVVERI